MKLSSFTLAGVATLWLTGCPATPPVPEPAPPEETAEPAAAPDAAAGTVTLPTGFPERPFVRVEFDKLTWRPTEGNTLGV